MKPVIAEFYKGKGAMRANCVGAKPKEEFPTGAGEAGTIFLECAAAKPEKARTYDWPNKISIALSPQEIVDLADVGTRPSIPENKKLDMYHDPGKGGPNEGKTFKTVNVFLGDNGGYSFTFRASKDGVKTEASITLSGNEYLRLRWYLRDSYRVVMGL